MKLLIILLFISSASYSQNFSTVPTRMNNHESPYKKKCGQLNNPCPIPFNATWALGIAGILFGGYKIRKVIKNAHYLTQENDITDPSLKNN